MFPIVACLPKMGTVTTYPGSHKGSQGNIQRTAGRFINKNETGQNGDSWEINKAETIVNQEKHKCSSHTWGLVRECFAALGPGRIAIIEGTINSALCQTILKEKVRSSVCELKLKCKWVMQQDNNPEHNCKSTIEWLRRNNIKVLERPRKVLT